MSGMDFGAVFTGTTLSAITCTMVMSVWAKLPFALAPGMGLNAFFAYGVVLDDFSESIPAFLTLLIMPMTYSIAEGIIIVMLYIHHSEALD